MTAFPVKSTLDRLGVRQVAEASGIPFWTLRKWRDADQIPGKGVAHDMRLQRVLEAVRKLDAAATKAKRARAAA